jgi:ankyrin repeat protein
MFIGSEQNFKNTENSNNDGGVKTTINLMKHIESNHVDEVNRILENESINKNTISAALNKALQNYKANSDMIDIIETLLKYILSNISHGADPNYLVNSNSVPKNQKVNVLMFSSMKGDVQLIHTILKHNPMVNAKDINNRNSLFYAIDSGKGDNADVIMSLIKAGINVNEVEKVKGHSPLSLATYKSLKNTVKALLDNNADPNHVVEASGDTILHLAVANNNIDIVKMLLEKGANPIASNKEGKSIVEMALKQSSTDIYRILLEECNRKNQKENEIVEQLVSENITSSKKKKKVEPINEEERKNIMMSVMNSMDTIKKDKKIMKTEFLKKIKKYEYSPNIQIPFSFHKNKANMFISKYD